MGNSITVEQFQKISRLDKTMPRIDYEINQLAITTGKPYEYYEAMELGKLEKLIAGNSIAIPNVAKATAFVKGGVLYKFATHPSQMTFGNFKLLQKLSYSEDELIANLHRIVALLSIGYRFGIVKLTPKEFERRADMFLKMPFANVYGYCLFFSAYLPILQEIGQAFSAGVMRAVHENQSTLQKFGLKLPTK